ncbi:MAG: flagellin [Betaproteobacteria bacterium]|nr:flagellin [Betaproteobacteria bacterium]
MSVINTNLKALVATESMRSNNLKLSTAMERLSTGLRINSAKDDAAGLAISNRMTAQVRGLSMSIRNSNDAISMAQTADGAYGQVTNMLQRMRELAVQASTGSLTASDRTSIQLEVDELKAEIVNVSETTQFNGIKLLDGSARKIQIQTGANQLETINIGFDSVKTKDIGSGDRPALTSFGGDATDVGRLSSGVLTINGVLVGQSFAEDDTLSFRGTTANANALASASIVAASAIAKVAAINRVTEQSGVFAKVDNTVVMGSTMSALNVSASGTITINGVETSTITVTTDSELSRSMVIDAINAISAQTGVRAINTGDDKQGITLVADDGRNITIEYDTLSAANTGVQATATYVGTFSLYSVDGRDITISQAYDKDVDALENSGLRAGVFKADIATMVTKHREALSAGAAATVFAGDTLVINDIAIGASVAKDDMSSHTDGATFTSGFKAASAIAIAAAINKKTSLHGVTATAEANVIRGTGFNATAASAAVFLNGVSFTVKSTTRNGIVDQINEFSGQTGVVARAWGEGIELVAEDGRNIYLTTDAASAAGLGLQGVAITGGETSATAQAFFASVRLTSDKAFSVTRGNEGDASGDDVMETLGFRQGTFGGKYTGEKIADVNVSTQQGAQNAITAIDHAISDVSAAQARSGAFQNRLDAIVNVLSESSENMSASRSRILDTDYATETTALARAQIIQQAATAMLAQANQQQQSVLALLQ